MKTLIDHATFEILEANAKYERYSDRVINATLHLLSSMQGHQLEDWEKQEVISLFAQLANFDILSKLKGDDDEWTKNDLLGPNGYQNNRFPRVVKIDNRVYDMEGILYEDVFGDLCMGADSWVRIDFPYAPETRILPQNDSWKSYLALETFTKNLLRR